MSDNVIRVGIAGQGYSGFLIHARWLREAPGLYQIAAAADELPERRAEAVRNFGCKVYRDYRDMLKAGGFDLFVNSLPTHLHPQGAIDALNAAYHVVCEKPLAVKVKDFDAMVAASKKARKVFAPFQNARFFPYFQKIEEVIASGIFGKIVNIRISWSKFGRRWDWQVKQKYWGGNLNDTAPHPLDHALMLMGARKPKVFSVLTHEVGSLGDADDFSSVVLTEKCKPYTEIFVSHYEAYQKGNYTNVNGEFGGLTGGMSGIQWKWYDPKKAPKQRLHTGWSHNREFPDETLPWQEDSWTPPNTGLDAFNEMSKPYYENIHDVIRGKGRLIVTHEQVRRLVAVLEEVHRQNPLPRWAK